MASLHLYMELCGMWRVFDDNGAQPAVVAEGRRGCVDHRTKDMAGLPEELATRLAALPS